MGVEDMTPDELRALAARKEAVELHRSHIPQDEAPVRGSGAREPWERDVEVDGTTYTVDMRRFRSRDFMRRAIAMQGGGASVSEQLDLFDYCFEPMEGQILAETVRRAGFEDFDVYYGICSAIFEAVEAKN